MKERDYVWCLVHQLLDWEEEAEWLCPECRQKVGREICPGCGKAVDSWGEGAENPNFDRERFQAMKKGGET